MSQPLLPTTVIGSHPQPDWLVDRAMLAASAVPRVRMPRMWRIPDEYLEEAQDDATRLAIADMERAGIDVITDGEIRRESYSNRFATALEGVDPTVITDYSGVERLLPRVVGRIVRRGAVEVRDMEFLRRNTDRTAKITLPGPFTMAIQSKNEFYEDLDELVMDYATAVNAEALELQAAGADVIQIDEPWVRYNLEAAERVAVGAINRAIAGLTVTTAVHICLGYAAVVKQAKASEYSFLSELAACDADQISIEAAQPRIDLGVLRDLSDKTIVLGVIDLADPAVETPTEVADRIRHGLQYVAADRLVAAPDCGMKYLPRDVACGKLAALVNGARLVRDELA